jgi:hypothetical protein
MDEDLALDCALFLPLFVERYGYRADCRHDVVLTGLERRQTPHHIRKRRTALSTFKTFSVNLLLAVSLLRLTVTYKCMRLSLGLRLTPNMASNNHDAWFPEQPTRLLSLDAMIAPRSS